MVRIDGLPTVNVPGVGRPALPAARRPAEPGTVRDFGNYLKEALALLNQQQLDVDRAAVELAMGEGADLHEVVLAAEKAGLSLGLAVQIRNKALEAYQEIMRMPV